MRSFRRVLLISTFALALTACQEGLETVVANKVEHPLPTEIVNRMEALDMQVRSPVFVRIFKEESILEIWKEKRDGTYDKVADYEICKWSGNLGPKFKEGDRQAPEGFYTVRPHQMNPNSNYYLAFNIGFPNAYDRSHGRTGSHLMVHGACSSAGCYSMTDEQILEIYAFARESFRGGQRAFQIQAFPFRMTPENMARHRDNEHFAFWEMLKVGYDHFEITKRPPKVDVCDRQYVFDQIPEKRNASFIPNASCPPSSTPKTLSVAYKAYQSDWNKAFETEVARLEKQEQREIEAEERRIARAEAKRLAAIRAEQRTQAVASAFAPITARLPGFLGGSDEEASEERNAQETMSSIADAPAPSARQISQPEIEDRPQASSEIDPANPGASQPETTIVVTSRDATADDDKPFWKIW